MSADAWCELCELPKMTCPHGAPPPPPPPPPAPKPPRASRATTPKAPVARRVPGTRMAPSEPTEPTGAVEPSPPVRRTPRTLPGRTAQSAFRPYVLAILSDHAGRLERELVLDELGTRMADVLQRDDLAVGPSGEVRWRTVVLKERRAMADDGLITSGGLGLWELTTTGYDALEAIREALAAAEAPAAEAPAAEAPAAEAPAAEAPAAEVDVQERAED